MCRLKNKSWGRPSQGCVTLANPKLKESDTTYLAEGAETALSIYQALGGADVRITLGKSNFKNIDPANTNQQVVLCLDNDRKNNQTDQLIHLAAEKLQEQGKSVMITQPKKEGWDYNDMLLQEGLTAVKNDLDQAIPYQNYLNQVSSTIILKQEQSVMLDKKSTKEKADSLNKSLIPTQQTVFRSEKSVELEI